MRKGEPSLKFCSALLLQPPAHTAQVIYFGWGLLSRRILSINHLVSSRQRHRRPSTMPFPFLDCIGVNASTPPSVPPTGTGEGGTVDHTPGASKQLGNLLRKDFVLITNDAFRHEHSPAFCGMLYLHVLDQFLSRAGRNCPRFTTGHCNPVVIHIETYFRSSLRGSHFLQDGAHSHEMCFGLCVRASFLSTEFTQQPTVRKAWLSQCHRRSDESNRTVRPKFTLLETTFPGFDNLDQSCDDGFVRRQRDGGPNQIVLQFSVGQLCSLLRRPKSRLMRPNLGWQDKMSRTFKVSHVNFCHEAPSR